MAGMSEAAWQHLVMDELAELAWEPKDGKRVLDQMETFAEDWSPEA